MALSNAEITRASGFLLANLDSYEQLEILRLLSATRDRSWTAGAVAKELGITEAGAARELDRLCVRNLLDVRLSGELHFRYSPGSEKLRSQSEAFLSALEEDPVVLARVMADHQRERERSAVLQAFVDAFLLRGPKNNG